jgi:hypothetical protein
MVRPSLYESLNRFSARLRYDPHKMALYKFGNYLQKSQSMAFEKEHIPGDSAPHSAIFRCTGCGVEVISEEGRSLPAKNHHQHTIHQGPIRWRMVVAIDQKLG